jgi:hypothetical protein
MAKHDRDRDNEVEDTAPKPILRDDLKPADQGKTGPLSPAVEPTRAKTVEEEGIGARDPYPEGSPPTSQTTANSPMAPVHQNINTEHPDAVSTAGNQTIPGVK